MHAGCGTVSRADRGGGELRPPGGGGHTARQPGRPRRRRLRRWGCRAYLPRPLHPGEMTCRVCYIQMNSPAAPATSRWIDLPRPLHPGELICHPCYIQVNWHALRATSRWIDLPRLLHPDELTCCAWYLYNQTCQAHNKTCARYIQVSYTVDR